MHVIAIVLMVSAPATVNETYNDAAAGEAFKICCYASACTFHAINECDALSPMGKVLAMTFASAGAFIGFTAGATAAIYVVAHTSRDGVTPTASMSPDDVDAALTLAFLAGALGVAVGGAFGMMVAFALDLGVTSITQRTNVVRVSEAPLRSPDAPRDARF